MNNRRTKTRRDNGRVSTRETTCQGAPLRETDENGITTIYAYDSARQLIEITRSEVCDTDGDCITPETITEYERDGAGGVLRTIERIGAMQRETRTEYDLQGRVVKKVDALGRITTTAYSEDGLTTTTTTPGGATSRR